MKTTSVFKKHRYPPEVLGDNVVLGIIDIYYPDPAKTYHMAISVCNLEPEFIKYEEKKTSKPCHLDKYLIIYDLYGKPGKRLRGKNLLAVLSHGMYCETLFSGTSVICRFKVLQTCPGPELDILTLTESLVKILEKDPGNILLRNLLDYLDWKVGRYIGPFGRFTFYITKLIEKLWKKINTKNCV